MSKETDYIPLVGHCLKRPYQKAAELSGQNEYNRRWFDRPLDTEMLLHPEPHTKKILPNIYLFFTSVSSYRSVKEGNLDSSF